MIQTLLNPNHVLTDCDNINDIDAQRMAAVLGKHLYGFKKGDERAVVKTLGLDANDDVCWSNTGVPGGGLPPSTPEDEGKVLVVGDDGQPEWADLPFGGDIAYSVDSATQANWNVDTLYASTQFYISNGGDNGGVEYYLDGQDRKAGYEVLEGHVYQVNFNCNATCASTSNNVWEGSVYITGPQDQNWYFQLDGSQTIDVSLTGSTIFRCSSDGVLYFNARLNGSYTGNLPTLSLSKVSIVDLTSAIGGSGGGSVPRYRPGEGIEITDDVISIDPTEAQEKLTAGPNIDIINNIISTEKVVVAAGQNVSITSSSDPSTRTITYTVNSSGGGVQPVQSNWAESDSLSLAYIQNKPQNLVQDADYTHTDNNFTDAEKTKLGNIEAGAEVNVQSNWAETDTGSDAYIQNKPNLAAVATSGSYTDLTDQPTIPSGTQLLPPATSADEDKILSVDENGYPEWVTPGSTQQVQSDWTEDDNTEPSYIQHKPTTKPIQAGTGISVVEYADNIQISGTVDPQVQADWTEVDNAEPDFIKNKPGVKQIVAGANVTINESNSQITISSTGAGGVPVQANWTQADSNQPDYIQNKPTIPADQVQSNWTETNTASKSFVLNKPTVKPIVAGTGISITETATEIIISLA